MDGRQNENQHDNIDAILLEWHGGAPIRRRGVQHKHFATLSIEFRVVLQDIDGLRRKITAINTKIWIDIVLRYGENGIADAAADFEDARHPWLTSVVVIGVGRQLRELGEQPMAILEELVLMDVIKRVPMLIGLIFEPLQFFSTEHHLRILRDTLQRLLLLFFVPFHVVPVESKSQYYTTNLAI